MGHRRREMLATGDWIVPRQQGRVFPERPPMTMWMMAIAGRLRGEVDPIAIRLPSVLAVVATSLLVFGYARAFASTFAATTAALSYATMGQVLQIGRHGESEALFALLVGGSLLGWHLGYMRGWRPLAVWTVGFALAALAALVKGPQAPAYFTAIVFAYLVVRKDLRYAISWQFIAGGAVFLAIVAAWQIPFYLATDWNAVVATWSGLAADRFALRGVLSHLVTYPLETFVCLLPWSPILVALASRQTRMSLLPLPARSAEPGEGGSLGGPDEGALANLDPITTFLITAIIVAYPTVWLAAGARGRYFMPLYPLVAVLVGLVVDRCSHAVLNSYPRRAWHQFLLLWGTFIGVSGILMGALSLFTTDPASRFYQPRWFALLYAAIAGSAACLLWYAYRRANKFRPIGAVIAIGAIAGIGAAGLVVNVNVAGWINPVGAVAELKHHLPPGTSLVSFSPIEHRFAYYFGDPLPELDWPRTTDDLPPDVNYFCFMRQPGDTAERVNLAADAPRTKRPARCRSPGKRSFRFASSGKCTTTTRESSCSARSCGHCSRQHRM